MDKRYIHLKNIKILTKVNLVNIKEFNLIGTVKPVRKTIPNKDNDRFGAFSCGDLFAVRRQEKLRQI